MGFGIFLKILLISVIVLPLNTHSISFPFSLSLFIFLYLFNMFLFLFCFFFFQWWSILVCGLSLVCAHVLFIKTNLRHTNTMNLCYAIFRFDVKIRGPYYSNIYYIGGNVQSRWYRGFDGNEIFKHVTWLSTITSLEYNRNGIKGKFLHEICFKLLHKHEKRSSFKSLCSVDPKCVH